MLPLVTKMRFSVRGMGISDKGNCILLSLTCETARPGKESTDRNWEGQPAQKTARTDELTDEFKDLLFVLVRASLAVLKQYDQKAI